MCARTNEVPLKTKFICRLFTRREPWFQTFQFASTGRDRNKHDAYFLRFYCTLKLKTDRAENLKQISQPFDIFKTRKIVKYFISLFISFSTHFFILINFTNIFERKFPKESQLPIVFAKFQVVEFSFLYPCISWFLSNNSCSKITVFRISKIEKVSQGRDRPFHSYRTSIIIYRLNRKLYCN